MKHILISITLLLGLITFTSASAVAETCAATHTVRAGENLFRNR